MPDPDHYFCIWEYCAGIVAISSGGLLDAIMRIEICCIFETHRNGCEDSRQLQKGGEPHKVQELVPSLVLACDPLVLD